MKRLLFLYLFAVGFFMPTAPAQQRCATNQVLDRLLRENPEMKQNMADIEEQTRLFTSSKTTEDLRTITIPVVVHIVWNTAEQNIGDDQVMNQLNVLNDDFTRMNADAVFTPVVWQSIAADCKINFCLAKQTPAGEPTTGIERRQTIVPAFSDDDAVKFYNSGGLDAWDRSRYLNLWVCNLGGDLLGYAQFPGGPAATDGVVIRYASFGTGGQPPYNLGRTATHEVGHWLNLWHIWGDDGDACYGSDYVLDTPNQAGSTSGCPAFPTISCLNYPNGDMFMNYMDYSDDACMNLFTAGQRSRMRALFAYHGFRASLLGSPGCEGATVACAAPTGLSVSQIQQTSALLHWDPVGGATGYTLDWRAAGATGWTTVSNIPAPPYLLTGLAPGTAYEFRVKTICGEVSGEYSATAMFTTLSPGGCQDQFEPNNSQSTAAGIAVNAPFQAQISSTTDPDWYVFSNSQAFPNIKVDLTNLPADYDLKLYRGSALLGSSQHSGTVDEQIVRNTNIVGDNYYAYVYGYKGAWNDTECYTLQVSLSNASWLNDQPAVLERLDAPPVQEGPALRLTPNPATDRVLVAVPVLHDADCAVTVSSMSGQVLQHWQTRLSEHANQFIINLDALPAGAYVVRVISNAFSLTGRLVVQK